ncbi:hypothetical protein SAY86_028390 [Trapa natans]|uniref:Uncharacterized protein n=1 Tax=Trapa natans TaxID=22666 RepID=A0AAN7M257_TRANT|nr:hypothetical protein SAY86_028390 [Trapa natans]
MKREGNFLCPFWICINKLDSFDPGGHIDIKRDPGKVSTQFSPNKVIVYGGEKMIKVPVLLLCLISLCVFAHSRPINPAESDPHVNRSFKPNSTQNTGSCSYAVTIKTSCSSVSYTRDQISLAFGDAYGNQVYAPRIDDPSTRTFERCSTDSFQILGPCTYQVCYVYLYRTGYDGWKPESVSIYGYYTKAITFYYNTFVPYGVWFGFNQCGSYLASTSSPSSAAA